MKIKISEKQLNFLLKEQNGDEPQSLERGMTSRKRIGTGRPGGGEYPVFSCLMYEPMTIKGEKIYPKNYPRTVEYYWYEEGDDSGKYKNFIWVIFHKYDSGGGRDLLRWVDIVCGTSKEEKYSRTMAISDISNTFICGADFSIEIDTPKISSTKFAQEDSSGNFVDCSSCSNTFDNLPTKTSFKSLNDFGKEIGKVTFDLSTLENKS